MIRYFKLWLSFLKMSWMADLEFRLNIVLRTLGESGWYIAQLCVFEVLYTHTKVISGWDVHAMRVFMGTLFISDIVYMILLMENVDHLFQLVKRGDLDLYLAKPINSQFMVSFRKVATAYLLNLVVLIGYLIWAVQALPHPVTGWQILNYVYLIGSGFVIFYALRFMFSTVTVVLQDAGNINYLWHQFYRLGMRPDPLYPMALRLLVLTLLPVAFFASVPARALIEGFDWRLNVLATGLALSLLWLSHYFWNEALKRYSSASS